MKKKIIISILVTFISLWTVFFATDLIRCKNDLEPIFCIKTSVYNDGGSKKYVGLFYNYYSLNSLNPDKTIDNNEPEYLVDKVITPWFFSVDFAKNKAFGE